MLKTIKTRKYYIYNIVDARYIYTTDSLSQVLANYNSNKRGYHPFSYKGIRLHIPFIERLKLLKVLK